MSLTLRGLRFQRPGGFTLDIDELTLGDGRVVVVLGPNGAGKSTLLRLIAGLERAGLAIAWNGAPPRTSDLAMCFQQAVFLRGTMRQNLDLALDIRRIPPDERTVRIAEASSACGVDPLLDRDAAALSAGERQRANLARALSLHAPLTLLDEPLAAVDAQTRDRLIAALPGLLRRFARLAVVVTHDRREALALADDLVILDEGRVIAAGSKAELCAAPPDARTARALGFVVLERDGARYAARPEDLRLDGRGGIEFELHVEALVDLGMSAEIVGTSGGERVHVACHGTAPTGERVSLHAVRAIRIP